MTKLHKNFGLYHRELYLCDEKLTKKDMKSMMRILLTGLAAMTISTSAVAQTEEKKEYTREKIQLVDGPTNIDDESAEMIADGHYYTKWCYDNASDLPYTLIVSTKEPIRLGQYGLVSAEDSYYYPGRNPLDWRVSGSNDKKSWTKLDERKFNWTMRDENEQEYIFKVKDAVSFRYYKFEFLKMQKDTRIQLSEINLYK